MRRGVYRADAEVERTAPGSNNDFRLEYDNSKKWTDDDPRDGIGDPDEREELFDDLSVKRMVKKLEKAVKKHLDAKDGATEDIKAVVKEMDTVLGQDVAKTVVRAIYETVNDEKVKKVVGIAKGIMTEGRKSSMNRFDRIALKVAHTLMADRLRDEIGIDSRTLFKATQQAIENWLDKNNYLNTTVEVDYSTRQEGKYWPGSYTQPPEYPNLVVDMEDVDVKTHKETMGISELADELAEKFRGVDPVKIQDSNVAMRIIKTAVDKWEMDMVDTPVSNGRRDIFDLPKGLLIMKAKVVGDAFIEFNHNKLDKSDLEEQVYEYEEKNQ